MVATVSERTPVTGPHRISADPTPTGVTLDISHFITTLLVQLAHDTDDDPTGVLDDLQQIAAADRAAHGSDSHAGHERDERVEALLDRLGGGRIHVYGRQAIALADRLWNVAQPRPVRVESGRVAS